MRLVIYTKPKLRDLSQGSRIAFARQFRHLSQDYVAERIGATGENKRRSMTRYEVGERNPKDFIDFNDILMDKIQPKAMQINMTLNSLSNAVKFALECGAPEQTIIETVENAIRDRSKTEDKPKTLIKR